MKSCENLNCIHYNKLFKIFFKYRKILNLILTGHERSMTPRLPRPKKKPVLRKILLIILLKVKYFLIKQSVT